MIGLPTAGAKTSMGGRIRRRKIPFDVSLLNLLKLLQWLFVTIVKHICSFLHAILSLQLHRTCRPQCFTFQRMCRVLAQSQAREPCSRSEDTLNKSTSLVTDTEDAVTPVALFSLV